MRKRIVFFVSFLILLAIVYFGVAWFIAAKAPGFISILLTWFDSYGGANSQDLLSDFTFFTALVITCAVTAVIAFIDSRLRNRRFASRRVSRRVSRRRSQPSR